MPMTTPTAYRNQMPSKSGAANTQFSKPWRSEVHVDGTGFPNGVLKHELVHAMAAGWGAWPFGVTSAFLVLPQTGVIEGLAVAADDPVEVGLA